jgi:hypothetical protein
MLKLKAEKENANPMRRKKCSWLPITFYSAIGDSMQDIKHKQEEKKWQIEKY